MYAAPRNTCNQELNQNKIHSMTSHARMSQTLSGLNGEAE